ncbi:MAG: DUF1491 family protein [Novosphingobium sp.]
MSEAARLPARLEVAAMLRRVQAEGGFAVVLRKGEPDGGTILVVLTENGANVRVFERMPAPSGHRIWYQSKTQDIENKAELSDWLTRRGDQDPDLWIVELDIANAERFIP